MNHSEEIRENLMINELDNTSVLLMHETVYNTFSEIAQVGRSVRFSELGRYIIRDFNDQEDREE